MISILILTKNEEQDLPGCLASVTWSDDVHVYDSGSTDATATIATRAGANFFERPFGNGKEIFRGDEAAHKNWALANRQFKYPWVLHLDADERVSAELAASMRQAIQSPGDKVAFRLQRRDFWGDRWLKHVQTSPHYLRLFRPEKMCYERFINPVSIPNGPVGELIGFLDHYPFSKGMTHWLDRHNSYSSLEARQLINNRVKNERFRPLQALFGKTLIERRFHQKELFYRMPARPLIKFLLLYIGKRGFLDGSAGLRYALLQSIYEYMIVLKTRELDSNSGIVLPSAPTPLNAGKRNLKRVHSSPQGND